MSREHKYRKELVLCPRCGRDSAKRKMHTETGKFCTICTSCGNRTRLYVTQSAASAAWNRGDLYEKPS